MKFPQGKRIKEYRKKLGWSQQKLANETGLHRVTIARYEAGTHTPSIDDLMKIANCLGFGISMFEDSKDLVFLPDSIYRIKSGLQLAINELENISANYGDDFSNDKKGLEKLLQLVFQIESEINQIIGERTIEHISSGLEALGSDNGKQNKL